MTTALSPAAPTASASVVTGQQLGLLGGPLFCVYKLFGALQLAARKRNHKAIYWLETHDADFSEANTLSFISRAGMPKRLHWRRKSYGMPVGMITIDSELVALLEYAFKEFPPTPYLADIKTLTLTSFRAGRRLETATQELMEACFADFPITFFNPNTRHFHDFSKPLLLQEAAATAIDAQCNLFALINGIRTSIFRTGQHRYETRSGTAVKLAEHVLLPNLQTRSVLQDAYLHARHYVAGPNEIQYLRTLQPSYKRHQVVAAQLHTRMRAILLTAAHTSSQQSLNIDLPTLQQVPYPLVAQKFLAQKSGINLQTTESELAQLKTKWLQELRQFIHTEQLAHQPLLSTQLRATERGLYRQLKHIRGARRKALKQRYAEDLTLLQTLSGWCFPFAAPQERSLNWLPFVARYGTLFLQTLYANHAFKEKVILLPAVAKDG